MEMLASQYCSPRLRSSQSLTNLPDVLSNPPYRTRQMIERLSSAEASDIDLRPGAQPMTSRYCSNSTTTPWRPSRYFGSARLPHCDNRMMQCTGPVVNSSGETAKLYELEGLKVPAIYSAARNALYTRYTPADWSKSHDNRLIQSDQARQRAERARVDATRLGLEAEDRTRRAREEVAKMLGERISDTNFLKTNLHEETNALIDEMNRLIESKRVLEKALAESENPLHITQECLYHREKRQTTDLVHDFPERALLKEVDVIKGCQNHMKALLQKATSQIGLCRAVQHELERDSADKFQALQLDSLSHQLKTCSAGIEYHDGVSNIPQCMSVPDKWAHHTAANLKRSQAERVASRRIREEIDRLLNAVTMRMRESWATSSSAIAQRAQETAEARNQIQVQLTKLNQEIYDTEKNMNYLKKCIEDKQGPLKLAQTRLDIRRRRPNMELCRDDPHGRLILEVAEIQESLDQLLRQLATTRDAHQELIRARGALEVDLSVKSNSLFIDREKCLGVRRTFPMTPSIIAPL